QSRSSEESTSHRGACHVPDRRHHNFHLHLRRAALHRAAIGRPLGGLVVELNKPLWPPAAHRPQRATEEDALRRNLAIRTLVGAGSLPVLLIPLDAMAFDFVSAMAALCLSPVALLAAIALTGAMDSRPLAAAPSIP